MPASVFPSVGELGGSSGRFEQVYRRSLEAPEEFWAHAATKIDWVSPWERVLDDSRAPFYRWFRGGRLNTCYNALDRHVERGRADQLALIYDSPVTGTVARLTYRELRDAVARFAGALAAEDVQRGDRVVIYMPMVPEAVIAAAPSLSSASLLMRPIRCTSCTRRARPVRRRESCATPVVMRSR
jgi:non-ribosomal peptide synthetase component F